MQGNGLRSKGGRGRHFSQKLGRGLKDGYIRF